MLSRRFDSRWWHHIIHTVIDYQLPGAWPNSVAEQHSVRDFLTPFMHSILIDSAVADDYAYSKNNGIECSILETDMRLRARN